MAQKTKSPPEKPSWFKRCPEAFGLFLFAFAITQILALCTFDARSHADNFLGMIGHALGLFWFFTTGAMAFGIFLISLWLGLLFTFNKNPPSIQGKTFAFLVFVSSSCLFLCVIGDMSPQIEKYFLHQFGFDDSGFLSLLVRKKRPPFKLGGVPFYSLFSQIGPLSLKNLCNNTGTMLLSSVGIVLSLAFLCEITLKNVIFWIKGFWFFCIDSIKELFQKFQTAREKRREDRWKIDETTHTMFTRNKPKKKLTEETIELPPSFVGIPAPLKKTVPLLEEPIDRLCNIKDSFPQDVVSDTKKKPIKQAVLDLAPLNPVDFNHYIMPPDDLLAVPKKADVSALKKELQQKAQLLEETLLSFGIEAKVGQIHCGPRITAFEVHPAVGVKIGKIKTLEHDIALNLEAKSIRIIAPIPGKAAVGIEVPNNVPQEVAFKDVLQTYQQQQTKLRIPMLLGKAVNGELVIADLTKMPHCIIAGATGSGKSVCINSIIMSILMTMRPDEIRLLMIDPKKVELTQYSESPFMLAPVITEPQHACTALNWLVKEMEVRYEILKRTGHRNIESFNLRKIDKEQESAHQIPIPEKMPYYVAIIDELADLMMVASQDIETPIARIAQMARAVGIHLILATQRPSREVITGLIKANFPARIAFKVASRINSQIILDDTGAETLLNNGDMLLLLPGMAHLVRAQGVFVRDEEINKVNAHLSKQLPPQYIIRSFDQLNLFESNGPSAQAEPNDALFEEAKNIVISTGNASTTFLQRKLKIGYARAASLMDELESRKIVGPQEGAKQRKILVALAQNKDEDTLFEDFAD